MNVSKKIYVMTFVTGMLQRRGLSDIGRTEQDIVFGEATSKDIVTLLNSFKTGDRSDMTQAEKLR